MKNSKLFRIAFIALVAALLCCALAFAVSAEEPEATESDIMYELTLKDGSVITYTKADNKSIYTVVKTANLVSVKCYTDIAVTASDGLALPSIVLDLNGHTLSGTRIHPATSVANTVAEIRNGNIVHQSGNFVYMIAIPEDFSSLEAMPTLIFDNCDIECGLNFAQIRDGNLVIRNNSTVTQNATTSGQLFWLHNDATSASVTIENSTVVTKSSLASIYPDDGDREKNFTIKNSTVTTSSSLLTFSDSTTKAPANTIAKVKVLGDQTRLSFSRFINKQAKNETPEFTFGHGAMMSAMPNIEKGTIQYINPNGDTVEIGEFVDSGDQTYPCIVAATAAKAYYVVTKSNGDVVRITDEAVTLADVLATENLKSIVCYTNPVVSADATGITIPAGVTFNLNGNKFTRDYQYVLTFADGASQYVFNNPTFNNVVATANLKSLVCYTDPQLTASLSLPSIVIDLNGRNLTQAGSYHMHVPDGNTAEIRNGTMAHTTSYFVHMGKPASSVVKAGTLILDNCTITAKTNQTFTIYNGHVVVRNSTITSAGTTRFIWMHKGGHNDSSFTLENSTVEAKGQFATIQRESVAAKAMSITIKDSTVTVPSSKVIFQFVSKKMYGAMNFEVLGASKLSCGSFATWGADTDFDTLPVFTFGYGVMMSAKPNIEKGTTQYINKNGVPVETGEFLDSGDTTLPYVVGAVQLPVRAQFALTLYTDFTLNLCFNEEDANKIASVKVGGAEITPVVNNGLHIYRIAGISAINAAKAQKIELVINDADTTVNKTIEYSIVDYANALLASDYSTESKQLVCRAVDYIKAVYDYTKTEIPAAIAALLENANYIAGDENATEVPAGNISTDALKPFLTGAKLKPDTGVKFRFFLQDNIGSGELTVSSRSEKVTYTVENSLIDGKNYFDVNMRAFDLYDGTVTLSYGDYTGTYDFKTYANSDDVKNDDNEYIGDLMIAIYNYFREANEYLKVADKEINTAK